MTDLLKQLEAWAESYQLIERNGHTLYRDRDAEDMLALLAPVLKAASHVVLCTRGGTMEQAYLSELDNALADLRAKLDMTDDANNPPLQDAYRFALECAQERADKLQKERDRLVRELDKVRNELLDLQLAQEGEGDEQ